MTWRGAIELDRAGLYKFSRQTKCTRGCLVKADYRTVVFAVL